MTTADRPRPRLGGVICPLVTPLTEDHRLDTVALGRQIDRVQAHVDGFMLLGTTGELALLTTGLADELVAAALEQIAPDKAVVLGIGETSTARVLDQLARFAPGIDYVAACTPYYLTSDDDSALPRHFRAVAELAPVPLVLYNIPQNTHRPIPLEVVEELREHPGIAGIKDSSGDAAFFDALLRLRTAGFAVLQGDESQAVRAHRNGADGFVSGLENIAPGTMRRLLTALDQSIESEVAAATGTIAALNATLSTDGRFWLSTLKAAVGILTGRSGLPMAPLPELHPDQLPALTRQLEQLGLVPELYPTP